MHKFRSVLDKAGAILQQKKGSDSEKREKAFKVLNRHFGKCYMIFKQLEELQELHRYYHDQLYVLITYLHDMNPPRKVSFLLKEIKKCKEMHLERILLIKSILRREKFID